MGAQSLIILLDVSGSMRGKERDMTMAVNKLLADLPKSALPVTITFFNDKIRTLVDAVPLSDVKEMSVADYATSGFTSLFDVVGAAVNKADAGTTIVIATDGEDTSSKEHTQKGVKKLVEAAKERGVKFIFICEGDESFRGGAHIGLTTGKGTTAFSSEPGQLSQGMYAAQASLSQALEEEVVPPPASRRRDSPDSPSSLQLEPSSEPTTVDGAKKRPKFE